jgi:hypothetical protein
MKTITVTFQISEERLLEALNDAGKGFGLVLSSDFNLDEFGEQLCSDIENYTDQGLTEFIEEGLNCDIYSEYFEDEEDED